MKILMLAPHSFYHDRGTPIAVNNVLRVLSARGDEVDVVTYHEGREMLYPSVTIYRTRRLRFVRNIKAGFSWKKIACDFVMLFTVWSLVRRKKYDLVHAVEESVFIAMALKFVYKLPYIYDMDSSLAQQMIEQFPILRPFNSLFELFERSAVRHAEAVVPVCDALADSIGRYKPKRVMTLHDVSLLEDEEIDSCEDLRVQLGIDGLILMYVGNLQNYQGIDLLLEGFERTPQSEKNTDLVVIGGTSEDIAHYQKMADQLGIAARTHFLGPRPIKHLAGYLAQADILVSPRIKGNNTPMKLYSYLHSGKALVATNLPTHTQVVDHESAILVAPQPADFARGLLRVIENDQQREQLGLAGRQLIDSKFSYPVFNSKVNMLFDSLAKERENPGKVIIASEKGYF